MNKEEYYKRIERINDKFKNDRLSADEEYQLVCQRNYLSTKYIGHLEQQCKKQKEVIDNINLIIKGLAYGGSENYYMENFNKINELLKEVPE